MHPFHNRTPLLVLIVHIYAFVLCNRAEVAISDSEEHPQRTAISSSTSKPPVSELALPSFLSLSQLSLFSDDLDINEYCIELLHTFGQRYVAYVKCLVLAARPVKVCQNCFASYGSFLASYHNISSDETGPGNDSCRDSLLRSDRLMLVYVLFNNMKDLWKKSDCINCITKGFNSLTNETLRFMSSLNQTRTCFENYENGNHTELCKNCKDKYKVLNEMYSSMEEKKDLCIDIEDAMNITRRLWSNHFNCSSSREETVPVIAVSSFMLFLPIIFYLSSFLHSEQKKRKLIHPKRAKSYSSLMNIQDKLS